MMRAIVAMLFPALTFSIVNSQGMGKEWTQWCGSDEKGLPGAFYFDRAIFVSGKKN